MNKELELERTYLVKYLPVDLKNNTESSSKMNCFFLSLNCVIIAVFVLTKKYDY